MNYIKKIILTSLFTIVLFFLFSFKVDAKEVNVYMFYGKTCPHCEEALEYLNEVKDKYDLNIIKYEVWFDVENKQKMDDITDYLDINVRGVPFVIINNTPITGYSSGVTDETYKYHIKLASKDSFVDKVGIELGVVNKDSNNIKNSSKKLSETYNIDFLMFKDIDIKSISPFISSLLLGLKDGFNLCNLWILLILFFALISLKDIRKTIILGAIYLAVFCVSHLGIIFIPRDFSNMINFIIMLRIIISFSLVIIGAKKLNAFINDLDGKTNEDKNGIKFYLQKNSLILMIFGAIILGAFSALISFNYNAGLSQTFISLISNLNIISYLLCILIYIIFFILFSFIVCFVLFVLIIKLNKTKSYNKYSKLVSGLFLLLIGILLLLKPDLF